METVRHDGTYLGDGVYAEEVEGEVRLTTFDGRTTTNTIYLEAVTMEHLLQYWASRLGHSRATMRGATGDA